MGANAFAEPRHAALEEAQLAIGIEAAVAHPAAQDEIKSRDRVGIERRVAGEQLANLLLRLLGEDFVGIDEEDPVAGAQVERDILLLAVAVEAVIEGLGAKGSGDFDGVVFRSLIDDDNLVGPANALQSARQVRLLVHGNDGYGQGLAHTGEG